MKYVVLLLSVFICPVVAAQSEQSHNSGGRESFQNRDVSWLQEINMAPE